MESIAVQLGHKCPGQFKQKGLIRHVPDIVKTLLKIPCVTWTDKCKTKAVRVAKVYNTGLEKKRVKKLRVICMIMACLSFAPNVPKVGKKRKLSVCWILWTNQLQCCCSMVCSYIFHPLCHIVGHLKYLIIWLENPKRPNNCLF